MDNFLSDCVELAMKSLTKPKKGKINTEVTLQNIIKEEEKVRKAQ